MNETSLKEQGSLDANILDVAEAIYSSELMLTYVSQEGINVEAEIWKTLIEARRQIKETPLSIDFEVKFWSAFNRLTEQIKPVTIFSLKSSLGTYEFHADKTKKTKPLNSQKAVFKYGFLAAISLFFLMFLQIYWIIGGKAVSELLTFFNEQNLIQEKLENLRYANRDQASDFEFNRLTKQYEIVDQKLDAQYRLLLAWNRIWRTLLMCGQLEWDVAELNQFKYKQSQGGTADGAETSGSDSAIAGIAEYIHLEQHQANGRFLFAEDNARQEMFLSIFSARFVLNSLQQYFLPLLYGFLGAITFILRTLTIQINRHTYSYKSEIEFRLKLALGALTGIAVGWFFSPDSSVLGSFSPLALAFLFGYNVEVFFALMDQIIHRMNTFLASKSST